jgi:hypothetical protein
MARGTPVVASRLPAATQSFMPTAPYVPSVFSPDQNAVRPWASMALSWR